jgi:hypothetical protein
LDSLVFGGCGGLGSGPRFGPPAGRFVPRPGGGAQALFGGQPGGGAAAGPGGAGRLGQNPFAGGGLFGRLFGGALEGGASLTQVEAYISAHGGGTLAVSSQSNAACAIIADHSKVAGIGGFTGAESDPSISWLAEEVASGHIRWVLASTGFAGFGLGGRPGASAALNAAARACVSVKALPSLYDCAGRAAALRSLSVS